MYDSMPQKRPRTETTIIEAAPTPAATSTEICRDYTKGRCARGSACKYLHLPPPSPASVVPALGLPPLPPSTAAAPYPYYAYYYSDPQYSQYYAKLYEMYALSASVFRVPAVKDHSKVEYIACKDFLNNKCTHGDDCKYAHVANAATLPKGALYQCLTRCGDFYNGKCSRGESCKYAHIVNAKQLEDRHKRSLVSGLPLSGSGSVSRSRYCQDFRKGKCNRGSSCKYSHAEELCRDFNRGECRFTAEQCRYVHKLYSEVDSERDATKSSPSQNPSPTNASSDDVTNTSNQNQQQLSTPSDDY